MEDAISLLLLKLLDVLPRDFDEVESILLICICTFQAIGAEYGEGFETFRSDGPLKVDVVSKILCPLMQNSFSHHLLFYTFKVTNLILLNKDCPNFLGLV